MLYPEIKPFDSHVFVTVKPPTSHEFCEWVSLMTCCKAGTVVIVAMGAPFNHVSFAGKSSFCEEHHGHLQVSSYTDMCPIALMLFMSGVENPGGASMCESYLLSGSW